MPRRFLAQTASHPQPIANAIPNNSILERKPSLSVLGIIVITESAPTAIKLNDAQTMDITHSTLTPLHEVLVSPARWFRHPRPLIFVL